jgi:hypothetical protein
LLLRGDVANRAGHLHTLLRFKRAQADLDLKFRSVFALAKEIQAGSHGTHGWFGEKAGAVSRVSTAETLGHEHFDRPAEQLLAAVAEEFLRLRIDKDDLTFFVDNHHGVGSGFEHGTKTLLRLLAPSDVAGGGEYA